MTEDCVSVEEEYATCTRRGCLWRYDLTEGDEWSDVVAAVVAAVIEHHRTAHADAT